MSAKPEWMLRPEDLIWNKTEEPEPEPAEPVDSVTGQSFAFPCPHECGRQFPSQGSLERHIEFEHSAAYEHELDTLRREAAEERELREAEDRVRAYERDRTDANDELPPWEREVAG